MEILSIDTSVFFKDNFNVGSTKYLKLLQLARHHHIKLLIPDIVQKEVHGHLKNKIHSAINDLNKFSQSASILKNLDNDFSYFFKKYNEEELFQKIKEFFNFFIEQMSAETIDTSNICSSEIINNYFEGKPPFKNSNKIKTTSNDKRFEFPDAIILSSLEQWANNNDSIVNLISVDSGWEEFASNKNCFTCFKTVEQFIENSLDRINIVPSIVKSLLDQKDQDVCKRIVEDISFNYHFFCINYDAEVIDTHSFKITNLDLSTVDFEIGDNVGVAIFSGTLSFKAEVEYGDPDSMFRDPDDRELYYRQKITQTLTRETPIEGEVNFYLDDNLNDCTIDSVTVSKPTDSIQINLEEDYF
ncbi:MAG: DUF4935 domain-containing protein [Halobacteriovoraceae bacterium]|nr:DUF4935 domain-containing protein [Halobacteriovoraceae bacterium]